MMLIYITIFVILMLTTLLLTILYKNIPVKSDEVQAEEIDEDIVEEEIQDTVLDSDSEDEDEILNGMTQGSSIKPPREISQPQPTVPIAPSPQPSAPPPPASLEPLPPTPPASLEPLPPTPPAPPASNYRYVPTYTVSHSVNQKTMTVNITNIKNAHNSFIITFEGSDGVVLKTHTLKAGETSLNFAVTEASYGSYDYVVKLNGKKTDTFSAIYTAPPPPPPPLPPAPPPPDQYQWITHNKKYHPFSALNGKFLDADGIPGASSSRITDISIDDCKEVCDEFEYCNSIQYTHGWQESIRPKGSTCYITSATVAGTGKPEDTPYFAQNESGTKIFQKSITKSYIPPPPASLEPLPPTPPAPPPQVESGKIIEVVPREFSFKEMSMQSRGQLEQYINTVKRSESSRNSIIDDYIKKQKESGKDNIISVEYVSVTIRPFSGKLHAYMKVNVSEKNDSPEEIQRKKDEEEAASKKKKEEEEAASKKKKEEEEAERYKKQLEEIEKREREELEKLADEFPTLKTLELKEILDNTWTLNSARTEAQKLLNEKEAAAAAQKKLEEEQKAAAAAEAAAAVAAAEAAAAEAKKKLEEEQKAAAEAAAAEAKKKLEEAKNEQERLQAIKGSGSGSGSGGSGSGSGRS